MAQSQTIKQKVQLCSLTSQLEAIILVLVSVSVTVSKNHCCYAYNLCSLSRMAQLQTDSPTQLITKMYISSHRRRLAGAAEQGMGALIPHF